MSTGFFGDIQKVKYEGPDSTNPLAFRYYNTDEVGSRQAHGRPSALRGCLLAHLHLAGRRPLWRPDLPPSLVRGHDESSQAQGRRRLRILLPARRALLLLPRCRRAPGRQELCREHQEPRTRLSTTSPKSRPLPAPSCSGARRTSLLEPPLHVGCCHQSGSGRLRFRRCDGQDLHRTPRRSSAAKTTFCGAAAKATKPCSTPISAASSTSSAASSTSSSSTSTRSATRARS